MKLTEKQLFIKDLLSHYEKGATCYDIIKDYSKELKEKGISTERINSVNATLASLVTKGLVDKDNHKGINPKTQNQCTLYILKENN